MELYQQSKQRKQERVSSFFFEGKREDLQDMQQMNMNMGVINYNMPGSFIRSFNFDED